MNYEEIVKTFFETIYDLILEINDQKDELKRIIKLMQLEDHMNHDVSNATGERLIHSHPYTCLCDFYKEEAEREREARKGDVKSKGVYRDIVCQEIIDTLYNNRLKVNMYKAGEDYIAKFDEKKETFHWERYEDYGSLTEIQDIRLIEKIDSLSIKRGKTGPRIACLGTLKRTDEFAAYFINRGVCPQIDEFLFQSRDVFWCAERNRIVELKNIMSLKSFLQDYDIIFFLDESYFYKRNQSSKSRDEKQAAAFVDFYWQLFQEQKGKLSLETVSFLFNMYDEALRFLKSEASAISAEREWDSQLLNLLEALVQNNQDCAEVYIYIYNSKIGESSIEHRAVCKEEYYDGKCLYVYKIADSKLEEEDGEDYNSPKRVGECLNGSSVDIWKFVKSISNSFYKKAFGQTEIEKWKNSRIEFTGGEQGEDKEDFCVFYSFDQSVSKDMQTFLYELMQIIGDKQELPCIRNYLKNLFYGAVLSRADGIAGLILAYKIRYCKNISFKRENRINDQRKMGVRLNTYKKRKAYYSIIERLSYARLHDFDQVERILKFDFKTRFADFLTDEQFVDCMIQINEACKNYGDMVSRLYLYSSVFAEE